MALALALALALAWRDGVRERWRWIRKGEGGGNPLLFTPVASPDGWGCPSSSLFPLFCGFV
ncbi:hypothetical protein A9G49_00315 [Aeromonas sp. ANP5]|nr:hypothetical protein A9G04_00315 [Aeromonas sp. ANNP30]OEC67592.1 hypothetical protein A9G49_00315 [Aeromonas sp. ANP5]